MRPRKFALPQTACKRRDAAHARQQDRSPNDTNRSCVLSNDVGALAATLHSLPAGPRRQGGNDTEQMFFQSYTSRKFALPQTGTGGYGIRPYVFCGGTPRVEFSPFVGNVIRRGAFYMRPQLSHDRAPTGGRGPDMSGPYRMLTGLPHPNAYRSCSVPRSRSRSPGRGPPRGRRTRRAGRRPAQSKRSCRVWLRRCSRC